MQCACDIPESGGTKVWTEIFLLDRQRTDRDDEDDEGPSRDKYEPLAARRWAPSQEQEKEGM
jgi:hypothetical protein